MNVHPIHAGRRMGKAVGLSCVVAIGLLILMIVGRVPGWGVVPMFLLTETLVYKAFSTTVRKRRQDVALLRCFGASRAQVFNGVLAEAAWIGLFGAVAGQCCTLLLLDIVQFELAVFALLVGIAGALLAALVPAIQASRIPPSGPSTVA